MKAVVIGAGLAGSEAALQLAKRGIEVDLYEMRPVKTTGAHKTDFFAELVCSNSLGSADTGAASGLLKAEMKMIGSFLMQVAQESKVPAGAALAVDRDLFGAKVTELINANPLINVIKEELTDIPTDVPVVVASGPLTSDALSLKIAEFTGESHLYFFDAVAPILEKDSINFDVAFFGSRYGKGDPSYINCPMNKEEYERFYEILVNAPTIELKEFEKGGKVFEGCMPVEVMGKRGVDTLRFGPMKPVGFEDPRTGKQPYALVQLRQDNMAGSLYNIVGFQTNLKWPSQKELIHSIPGLESASIVRYGVMHRNTFIHSPSVLNPTFQSRKRSDLFFAGQISGVEGYTESIASGLMAGINLANHLTGQDMLVFDNRSIIGALSRYITCSEHKHFQPINSNWGLLEPLDVPRKVLKDKKLKNSLYAQRAIEYLQSVTGNSLTV